MMNCEEKDLIESLYRSLSRAERSGLTHFHIFSSAVPSGSGAFQMPTRPSSSASTLRGGRANLRNASVTFSLFWHEASLG